MLAIDCHLAANIDNSADLRRASDYYVPTKQSVEFVNQLINLSMHGGGAHSLQGAYGAGKSSLAIFAMNQLAAKTKIFTPNRKIKLGWKVHSSVKRIQKQGGMLAVPVVGSASPLAQRISVGLRNAANNYSGIRPKTLLQFTKLDPRLVTNEQLLQALEELIVDKHPNSAGLLLMIDEFGRQFEHMIATGSLDDLHLLQNLAEMPGKGNVPFSIVIIQHHGLEHYTNRFMSQQHAEWGKVRGRFNEFLLNNSETDTANIISMILKSSKRAERVRNLPKPLDKEFIEAAGKCCPPLHPMTIYILARLSRILGQGDRTVVGWISSHLDTGFSAAMKNNGNLLYPNSLFRHFFGDIQNNPTNPVIAKRFNVVHNAYNRLAVADQSISARVLKTIGLLHFCHGTGLKADLETIKLSLPEIDRKKLKKEIKSLELKSLITYRRYSSEYRVWEGSDYDIQTILNEVVQSVEFSPAQAIDGFVPKRVLAHRHFIETGNHRTAELTWVDKEQPIEFPEESHGPRIYVWLDKAPKFKHSQLRNCVWGVIDTKGFADLLHEAAALEHMLANDLELQQDAVASSEVKEQLAFIKSRITNGVSSSLNAGIKWHLRSDKNVSLQQVISKMMDLIYKESFPLHNELINKEKTSGQATLAVRLLIEAMVQQTTSERFGIDKFPAERLIYESMFRETKIHKKLGKDWKLTLDSKVIAPKMKKVMKLILLMTKASSSSTPCEVGKIVAELGKPPHGIKQIPATLLCCIFIFVRKDYVELYEDGALLPTWSDQTLYRLVRSPDSFGLNIPASIGYSDDFLEQYRYALQGSNKTNGKPTPLNIAKDILVRYFSFSDYAKKTKALSKEALALRRAVLSAKSPADMLFVDFPRVVGFSAFPKQAAKRKLYFQKLAENLSELEQADKKLVDGFEKILLKGYNKRQLRTAKKIIEDKARKVKTGSRMHHSYESFLNAVLDSSYIEPLQWLRNLLDKGLDILTPLDAWSDEEVAKAEFNFMTKLIWLYQAAEAMAIISSANGTKITSNGKKRKESTMHSTLKKQLKNLPVEEIFSLLMDSLNKRGRANF